MSDILARFYLLKLYLSDEIKLIELEYQLSHYFPVGIKAALTCDNLCEGQLVVFGTPAEEGGGGKVIMIEKGCFDDVDFCMMAHPYVEDIIYHPELSFEHLQITYHGR